MERARTGDDEALSLLVEACQNRLFRFCFYLTADRPAAEDLCQETFVRVLTRLADLEDDSKFFPWLLQIAKNLFLDRVRSAKKTEELAEEPAAPSGSSPDLHLQIARALASLSEDERLVLLLVDQLGHSYGEAAGILGISEAALTSRIHRARNAFTERFDADERNGKATPSTERKETHGGSRRQDG